MHLECASVSYNHVVFERHQSCVPIKGSHPSSAAFEDQWCQSGLACNILKATSNAAADKSCSSIPKQWRNQRVDPSLSYLSQGSLRAGDEASCIGGWTAVRAEARSKSETSWWWSNSVWSLKSSWPTLLRGFDVSVNANEWGCTNLMCLVFF